MNNNTLAFFELLRAGLWEKEARLSMYGGIDFMEINQIAEEQSVVGLLAAGLEHVQDVKLPKKVVLQFVGQALQIEQRNLTMNVFVAKLIELLRKKEVYSILVKGQGIAQCYERPLWREAGDVDLLLASDDYEKTKKLLIPLATVVEQEFSHFKHQAMTIDGWEVELHGTLHSRLSKRVDRIIDQVQADIFYGGNVRSWQNGNTQVFLPAPNVDVIFVFTHILHHFFFEGIGLRQICDWCRLLWTFRGKIDINLLGKRLKKAGIMTEWKAFASFVVDYLGMPEDAMPFYSNDAKWGKKAEMISSDVMRVGNFGHNCLKERKEHPFLLQKLNSFRKRMCDMLRHFRLFPKDSLFFIEGVLISGFHAFIRSE